MVRRHSRTGRCSPEGCGACGAGASPGQGPVPAAARVGRRSTAYHAAWAVRACGLRLLGSVRPAGSGCPTRSVGRDGERDQARCHNYGAQFGVCAGVQARTAPAQPGPRRRGIDVDRVDLADVRGGIRVPLGPVARTRGLGRLARRARYAAATTGWPGCRASRPFAARRRGGRARRPVSARGRPTASRARKWRRCSARPPRRPCASSALATWVSPPLHLARVGYAGSSSTSLCPVIKASRPWRSASTEAKTLESGPTLPPATRTAAAACPRTPRPSEIR